MNNEQSNRLAYLAAILRAAIDRAKQASDPRICWLDRFPRNCCDHTSQILSLFLYRHGFQNLRMVTAEFAGQAGQPFPSKHVWLQFDDLVIDITADQFESVTDRVLVCQTTQFHGLLAIKETKPLGIDEGEDAYFRRISSNDVVSLWYETIMEYVELIASGESRTGPTSEG